MTEGRFGLGQATIDKIRAVFAAHPEVESAVLYGSRAKGSHRPGSDIDLTLHGKDLNDRILLDLMGELDDLLLPYTFDLSIFVALGHPGLEDHIRRVGQVFYERAPAAP